MQLGRHDLHLPHKISRILLYAAALGVAVASIYPLVNAQPTNASVAAYSFDIAGQPLPSALRQFAQQSRQEILFAPSLVAGKKSPGVSGSMTPMRALEALLKDCGITWSTTPAGIILLHEQTESSTKKDVKKDSG